MKSIFSPAATPDCLGIGDGTINLCLAVDGRRLGERIGIEALLQSHLPRNPHLREILRASEPLGPVRSTYPVSSRRALVADAVVVLVGDARAKK